MFKVCSAAVVILGLAPWPVLAAVRYVNPSAVGSGAGTSWGDAYTNLQTAITAASSGEEVWVAQGLYTNHIQLKASVAVYGGFAAIETARLQRDWAAHETTIDPQGSGIAVTFANGARLDGFTIAHGLGTPGAIGNGAGAHLFRVNGAIENCWFRDNSGGAAVTMTQTGPNETLVRNCRFEGNQAAAIAIYGRDNFGTPPHLVTVDRCAFISNSAAANGGAIQIGFASDWQKIGNSIFYGNRSTTGYGGALSATPLNPSDLPVFNCTFLENKAVTGGHAVQLQADMHAKIENCIVWGTNTSQFALVKSAGVSPVLNLGHDDIQNGTNSVQFVLGGTIIDLGGNITGDPLLVSPPTGDFTLGPFSPCVDAGTTNVPAEASVDFAGQSRPHGVAYDIGALEQQALRPVTGLQLLVR